MADNTACSASSEYGGRRSRYGSRASACGWGAIENSTGELDIFPGRTLPGWIAQECGGMVRDDQRHPVVAMNLVPELPNGKLRIEQRLRSERAEGEYHLGADQFDLPDEVRATRRNLLRPRVAVARRPVLQDVADVDIFAPQLDRGENLREQLTGRADERPSRFILGCSRRFADAHEPGVGIPFPWDRVD